MVTRERNAVTPTVVEMNTGLRGRFALALFCHLVTLPPCHLVSAAEPTYWQDVRPVLRKSCTACHNAKHKGDRDVSGGLALDSYDAVLKGAKEPVIRVGKSADSPLIKAVVTTDADKRMPLAATPLPPEMIDLLRHWID